LVLPTVFDFDLLKSLLPVYKPSIIIFLSISKLGLGDVHGVFDEPLMGVLGDKRILLSGRQQQKILFVLLFPFDFCACQGVMPSLQRFYAY